MREKDGRKGKDATAHAPRQTDVQVAELAEHIAAVLAHPDTPRRLYDAITQEIAAMYSDIPARESVDAAWMLDPILRWHNRQSE